MKLSSALLWIGWNISRKFHCLRFSTSLVMPNQTLFWKFLGNGWSAVPLSKLSHMATLFAIFGMKSCEILCTFWTYILSMPFEQQWLRSAAISEDNWKKTSFLLVYIFSNISRLRSKWQNLWKLVLENLIFFQILFKFSKFMHFRQSYDRQKVFRIFPL